MGRQLCKPRSISGSPRAAPAPVTIKALIFDEEFVTRFISSVAHAMVLEKSTKAVWVEYRDSAVLNGIYWFMGGMLGYGAPGTVQVDAVDIDRINSQKAEKEMHLYEAFVEAMTQGPARAMRFLNLHDELRTRCLESVQEVYRDVSRINAGVANEARRGVARLELIKAASTVGVKTLGLFAGGLPAFLWGSAYDISLDVIDNLDKGESAVAVGMASKSFSKLWKKGVKDAAKNLGNIYKNEASGPAGKIEWLTKRLEAIDSELNAKGIAERSAKYAKDARRLGRVEEEALSSSRAAKAMYAVKYAFFAYDIYKAGDRLVSDLHAAGYEHWYTGVSDAFSRGD